jgi:hypothetical protein
MPSQIGKIPVFLAVWQSTSPKNRDWEIMQRGVHCALFLEGDNERLGRTTVQV